MCNFNIGGKLYSTLDYDVMLRKPSRRYKRSTNSFKERAEEELLSLNKEDLAHQFINIYSECGYSFHTSEAEKSISLSMVGQDYVCTQGVKRLKSCTSLAVYYNTGRGKPKLLWNVERFSPGKTPVFLNRKEMLRVLRPLFSSVKISLGLLIDGGMHSIAWQVSTEKGVFFIPWHSGCLVERSASLEFEEKPFEELRNTYKCLFFGYDFMDKDVFCILIA